MAGPPGSAPPLARASSLANRLPLLGGFATALGQVPPQCRGSRWRRRAAPSLLALAAASALVVSAAPFVRWARPPVLAGRRADRGVSRLPCSAGDGGLGVESPDEIEEPQVVSPVPEFIELATKGDIPTLMERVDKEYNLISVQDIMDLQEKSQQALSAAGGDDADAAVNASPEFKVLEAIQVSTEKRMAEAKTKIEELIATKTGDVNQRIKKMLKGLDSPLPLIMVLQMNIAQAQYNKDDDSMRAFMHINTIVQEELEKKVPRVQALLNRLMRMDSESVRNNLLRHHLTPVQVAAVAPDFDDGEEDVSSSKLMGASVPPEKLADAISNLVQNVDQQLQAVGTDEANEARFETMEKIRDIAIEARLVIGEVYGEGEMDRFGAALTPAFHTLLVYNQQRKDREMAAAAAEQGAAATGPGAAPQAPAEQAPGS